MTGPPVPYRTGVTARRERPNAPTPDEPSRTATKPAPFAGMPVLSVSVLSVPSTSWFLAAGEVAPADQALVKTSSSAPPTMPMLTESGAVTDVPGSGALMLSGNLLAAGLVTDTTPHGASAPTVQCESVTVPRV